MTVPPREGRSGEYRASAGGLRPRYSGGDKRSAGHGHVAAARERHQRVVGVLHANGDVVVRGRGIGRAEPEFDRLDRIPGGEVIGQSNFYSNNTATTQAGMKSPSGLAYDASGNRLFVSELGNHRVTVYDAAASSSSSPSPSFFFFFGW